MATAITLNPKRLWLILDAQIAAEKARYEREDPAEDAGGDCWRCGHVG